MMLEIILGISCILLIGLSYVIWNLLKKMEILENWIETILIQVETTYLEMKKIDSSGHFESDDEIGSIFTAIHRLIQNLNNYISGEEE